jgi:hypothetical protein
MSAKIRDFERHLGGAIICVEYADRHVSAMLSGGPCGYGPTEALVVEAGEKLQECLNLLQTVAASRSARDGTQ